MTLEEQLINKTYYKVTYMNGQEEKHPIQVLGDAYLLEQQNDLPDLSFIRYAQGEVYFQYKDFEAAIFKWENIHNELQPWARKNMADAYLELGLVKDAEEIYLSIQPESPSPTLHAEVSLQLFSLYMDQGNIDKADKVLKEVVSLNPDYPNVTEIARRFYEEQEKVQDAVELAVNEAMRTDSLEWFQFVGEYVEKGWTKTYKPEYFKDFIKSVHQVDLKCFEQTVVSLWKSFKKGDSYLEWLKVLNHVLSEMEIHKNAVISSLYKEAYVDLIEGSYYIKEISTIIPDHLTNWQRVSVATDKIFAASAILAWSEMFPSSIDLGVISDAEYNICHTEKLDNVLSYCLKLYNSIAEWARSHELEVGQKMKWMVQQLMDSNVQHLMIAGPTGNGKSSFINSVLGENILKPSTSSIVVFKDSDAVDIHEITDTTIKRVEDISDFQQITASQLHTKVIEFGLPCDFFYKNGIAFIDSPSFQGNAKTRNEFFHYLQLADSLIFVLNASVPFTDKECDILLQIQKFAPSLPIYFVLNKIDTIYGEHEANRIIEETESRLSEYFPSAKVFPYSSVYDSGDQLDQLAEFVKADNDHEALQQGRTEKLLFLIRQLITELLERRVKMETDIVNSISWNEDIAGRLTGALHQLKDLEGEKIQHIQTEYQMMEEEIRNEVINTIPTILKGCTDFIKEDSDFRHFHSELNDEMNNRVQDYLHNDILPKYYELLKKWIANTNGEFNQCKEYLDEMCESLNRLYGEDRLKLEFDFRVIDDWSRDADRMTNAVRLEKINILSKNTPTQLLLTGAGKLFGGMKQNRSMLYNKYKSMVDSEDYYEVAVIIANKFLQQFDLFEKGLDRDISMFFHHPLSVFEQIIAETYEKIQSQNDTLQNLRANPESYKDPITLFEVRLRQYEWIKDVGKDVQPIY
ncbi:dynamin family protein [Margalitia sp. FSL K6-0131]|uniref:dynamin family protein n=1 Tax=Margalitia sp. FSL K6-0131 TaxID=2954604 RepID=UPI0030FA85E0